MLIAVFLHVAMTCGPRMRSVLAREVAVFACRIKGVDTFGL